MSKVALTEDHRFKLVEMTRFVMYQYDISIDDDTSPFIYYEHKTDTDKKGKIYWLEHIVYHIAKKILNRDDNAIMLFKNCCLTNIMPSNSPHHPIIYLYERYKRNKEAREKQLQLPLN
jgi:hypothetical protein